MEHLERGSLASFGSGGTTDSEARPPLAHQEARVSKVRGPPGPPSNPPNRPKEKEAKKEVVVVVVVAEEEEEEKEEERLPPAMNALDPSKRLDRLVSFLKL